MTGTAATEAAEFHQIYKMNVVTIPTNVLVARVDEEDTFYKDTTDKFRGIAKAIAEKAAIGQPVLVGTVSIEKSEQLSEMLNTYEHQVEISRTLKPGFVGKDKEAAKLGFSVAIVPKANAPKKNDKAFEGLTIYAVERIEQALEVVRSLQ